MTRLLTWDNEGDTAPTKNGTVEFDASVKAFGANSLKFPIEEGSYAQWSLTTVLAREYFIRAYFRYAGSVTTEARLLNILNAGSTSAFTLRITTGKKLKAVSTAGAKIGSESGVIEPGAFHYYELGLKVPVAGSGTCTLKLDGSVVFTSAEAAITNEVLKFFRFGRPSNTTTGMTSVWNDSIAINDDQGSSDNTFPGQFVETASGLAIPISAKRILVQP